MRRDFLAGLAPLLALLLAGCMPNRSHEPERYFVLAPAAAPLRYTGPAVMVAPTSAVPFYGSVQIVYSDSPGTRSRYRYSFWTEPPQAMLHAQLASTLEDAGGAPRFVLATRLQELYHDAGTAPGVVRVTVNARLESLPDRALLAQRSFSRSAPARAFSAPGAVAAMRTVLAGVLDDIVVWVAAQAAQNAGAAESAAPGFRSYARAPAAPPAAPESRSTPPPPRARTRAP
jgi:ABC-type uncharacterized transport system auxiliary subunit